MNIVINGRMFFLTLLICYTGIAQTFTTDTLRLGLEEAWTKTVLHSKQLKEAQFKSEINQELITDAKRAALPTIDLEAEYGKISNFSVFVDGITDKPENAPLENHNTYGASISGYFNVYSGHANKIKIETARAHLELQQLLIFETEDQLHLELIEDYLKLQRAFLFKDLIIQNIIQNEENVKHINQLYTNGVVLKSDLLRAKLQLSKQHTSLVTINNNIAIATQAINILIGNPDNTPILPVDTLEQTNSNILSYDHYVDQSIQKSPLSLMAANQIKLSELKEAALVADKYPKIGLYAGYNYSYPQILLYPYSFNSYLLGRAGIRISYDLSSIWHDKHKEKAAAIEIAQNKTAKQNIEDALRKKLNTAYRKYQEDLDNISIAKDNIIQATESYRIVKQSYFNQLALLTELLDADTQLLQAKFELLDDQIAARLHYYQLLKISGTL